MVRSRFGRGRSLIPRTATEIPRAADTSVVMTDRQPLFDVYVVVDWSANSTPKRGPDSIWTHVTERGGAMQEPINHPTRADAREYLVGLLTVHPHQRILVGFDMPYGYPSGFAQAAGLPGEPAWAAAWQHLVVNIDDRANNANNRFEVASQLNAAISDGPGPFWGTTSPAHVTSSLSRTKAPGFPHHGLAEHRHAEQALRSAGMRPASAWQLAGAGSAGSQTLMGVPVVHALRHHPSLRARSAIWPFETGLTADPVRGRRNMIIHAEIWPSSIGRPDPALHPVKDAGQVRALGEHLAALDDRAELGPLFAPVLDDDVARAVVEEEGWIVGAVV